MTRSSKFNIGDKVTDQAFPGSIGLEVIATRFDPMSGVEEVLVDHSVFGPPHGQHWHLANLLRLWKPSDANPLPWEV